MSVRVDRIKEHRKRAIKFLVCIGLAGALFCFLRFGCKLTNLEIKGCNYYEEEALRSWLCSNEWENQTWYLYLKLRFGEEPSIPFIEEIEVDFVDLHTLRLGVYEKEIIGGIPYMGEYVCFDKDGIMVGSITECPEGVPAVTGIPYEKIVYNEKVDTPHSEVFSVILNVTQLIRKYKLPVERLDFAFDQEITLYADDIRVFLGKRDQYDEPLSALAGILKEADGMKGTLNMKEYSRQNPNVVFVSD